jgi:rhamnogalacturonyl hydrolase YesR
VRTLSSKTITLEVKQRIHEKESINPDHQRLIFERKELKDDENLLYYNAHAESVHTTLDDAIKGRRERWSRERSKKCYTSKRTCFTDQ